MRKLLLLFPAFIWTFYVNAQIQISVTIDSGSSTTTCTDVFGAPDPMWSVNIDNEGEVFYPEAGNCFTSLPNTQYTANYACLDDVPSTIQVCFNAFENDDLLAAFCEVTKACSETICGDIPIPLENSSGTFTLDITDGLSSDGQVTFTVTNTSLLSNAGNDTICTAVDLGVLQFADTLGNASIGSFDNFCATNTNDVQTNLDGFFFNDAGVWFSFTTGPDPSGEIFVNTISDPEATGFDIDLQVAVYTSDDNTCNGVLQPIGSDFINASNDSWLPIECPSPNTTYFIIVDGHGATDLNGIFGIEVIDYGIAEGGDLRCEFEDLGEVPEGGSVETPNWVSNFCATDSDDPYVQAFVSQHSVWFGFIAPPSGHVLIEGITDTLIDSIGLQIALYRSFNTFCNGPFGHVMSEYDDSTLDQEMVATCLYPGRPYWILVDGTGFNAKGFFKIRVTDNGDITPKTTIDTTICAGASYNVGSSSYTETGSYSDTLQLFAGCDSIVFTNLTVLEPLTTTLDTFPAIGMTATGVATATPSGGSGNYSYQWCSGETGQTASMLVGGTNCCVTITDDTDCVLVECFTVPFLTTIIPIFENDSLNCFGENTGIISFQTFNGEPPYNYSWSQSSSGLNGSGMIAAEGDETSITDLPGGEVEITISDINFDTTFTALVYEPEEIQITLDLNQGASCFGICDGILEISATGGTGDLNYNWSNGATSEEIQDLCSGDYSVTVSDENGCEITADFFVDQPLEFIASPNVIQNVSCFEGSDGHAGLLLENGTAASYNWINNETTAEINGLTAGFYDVTVTNTDGCEAYTSVEISQPSAPLLANIEILNEVSCFGENDAVLSAEVSGPGNVLNYTWSSGAQSAIAPNLGAGNYDLTVTNENNCEALASFVVTEPPQLLASISAKDITCLDPPNGGEIYIDTVFGGVPNYYFSIDGENFSSFETFSGLEEGYYEVIVKDESGCEKNLDITVQGPPELSVDLGEDYEISLGEEISIQAIANSDDLTYEWNISDTLTGFEIVDRPLVSTLYSVMVYDTITYCTAEDAIFIWINKDRNVFIPNAFSPNNDGVNDQFLIYGGVGIEKVKSFRIFSRAGDLVYQGENFYPNDPGSSWDGKFNGHPMNPGVFVFVAEIEFIDGITEIFKGEVVLLKQFY